MHPLTDISHELPTFPIMTTSRLLLREFNMDDVPAVFAILHREDVNKRLAANLQGGRVDFIALCRPLIREPDLPNHWRAGIGKRLPECVSCNCCIYAMIVHPGKPGPGLVSCICKHDEKVCHRNAQDFGITAACYGPAW